MAWCPVIRMRWCVCADAVDFGVRSSRSSSAAGGIKPELFDIVLEHISQNDGEHGQAALQSQSSAMT